MLEIKHATVATAADDPDAEINKAQWNEPHSITGTALKLLGFDALGNFIEVDRAEIGGGTGTGLVVQGMNGNDAADNSTILQAAADTGALHIICPPPTAAYRLTDGVKLNPGQKITGVLNSRQNLSAGGDVGTTLFNFVPASGSARTAFRNKVGAQGCGLEDISVKLNRNTDVAVGISGSYANTFRRVNVMGPMDVGFFLNDTYVCLFEDCTLNGSSIRRYGFYVQSCNDVSFIRPHFSGLPNDNALMSVAIGIRDGNKFLIMSPVYQGHTVGLSLRNPKSVLQLGAYSENTLCCLRTGVSGSLSDLLDVASKYSAPFASHPQYASRGPLIWAEGSDAHFVRPRFLNTNAGTGGTGAGVIPSIYPIVLGLGMKCIQVDGAHWNTSNARAEIFRAIAGASPGIVINGNDFDPGDTHGTEILLKNFGSYGSNCTGIRFNAANQLVPTAWQPAVVPTPVSALLSSAFAEPVLPA